LILLYLQVLFLAIMAGVVYLVLSGIRKIPEAYAWNPDSHDKITSYSLALLKNDKKTLLGWVLNEADERSYRKEHLFQQLRRGSVDEDMSSDVFSGIEKLNSWFESVVNVLTALQATRPIGYVLLCARAAGKYHLKARDPDQFVEGTNGGYHFYNPASGVGLSEKTFVAEILQKLADCVTRPMPTAVTRAMDPNFQNIKGNPWCFDLEKRNYTLPDADDYFSRGYYHLSFYSTGRVLHLLQDMSVPAHVRDDSHFGIGMDFSEPLEYYADLLDYVARGGHGGLRGKNEERWRYEATGEYNVSVQASHLSDATELFPSVFSEYKTASFENFFRGLARKTHDGQYSAGTIPGNADSHDPDNTDVVPWIPLYPPDFSKCQPNVGSLVDVLRFCQTSVKSVVTYMNATPGLSGRIDPAAPEKCTLPDHPSPSDIISFIDCLTPLVNALPVDVLNPDKRDIWNEGPEPTVRSGSFDIPKSDRRNFYLMSTNVRERWDPLIQLQKLLSSNSQLSVKNAMKEWITNYQDRKKLSAVFNGFHGPCCIVNNNEKPLDKENYRIREEDCSPVLEKQYVTTEVDAIAFSAAFLAKWFESQYSPEKKRGLGIWISSDTSMKSHVMDPDEVLGNHILEQNDDYAWPNDKSVGNVGIVNHIPVDLDILVELSIEDMSEEDSDAFPEGIRIKAAYGHFEPEGENSVQELSEITLTKGLRTEWTLKGCKPYNSSGQDKVKIPIENVSYTGAVPMGGIRRDQVDTVLKAISTYPQVTPDKPSLSEDTLPLPVRGIFEKMNSTVLSLELNIGKAGNNAE
jgi:hypothetical protein